MEFQVHYHVYKSSSLACILIWIQSTHSHLCLGLLVATFMFSYKNNICICSLSCERCMPHPYIKSDQWYHMRELIILWLWESSMWWVHSCFFQGVVNDSSIWMTEYQDKFTHGNKFKTDHLSKRPSSAPPSRRFAGWRYSWLNELVSWNKYILTQQ